MSRATLLDGNVLDVLPILPDGSVRCCVTSPPYWGLRDYGVEGQLGLERTPEEYVERMVAVFREVRRVLADDGTLWLNLGDSYAGSWGSQGRQGNGGQMAGRAVVGARSLSHQQIQASQRHQSGTGSLDRTPGLKPKDLVGIPWRVAFALQADGWVLRSEIIWSKPNPMPESVTDRPTKAHEQLFLFSRASWRGPAPGRFAAVGREDARWLAALIDCEGSIVVKRGKLDGRADVYAPQVSIGNTSRALVERVAATVGHGNVLERPGKNAPMFYWQVAHGLAADFLRLVYPHLVVKQRQARIGIYVDTLLYRRGGQKLERKQRTAAEDAALESLWLRNKECNHFGSPDLSDIPEPNYGSWGAGPRYYFDAAAVAEPATFPDGPNSPESISSPHGQGFTRRAKSGNVARKLGDERGRPGSHLGGSIPWEGATRNTRSVWTIATQPYPEAHFATFPEELARRCIVAGSAPGDTVLDPFSGSGTVAAVAIGNGRHAIGVELNPTYQDMARRRIGPMFVEAVAP